VLQKTPQLFKVI